MLPDGSSTVAEVVAAPQSAALSDLPVPPPVSPPATSGEDLSPAPSAGAIPIESEEADDGSAPVVGGTASNDLWELTLISYGRYEQVVGRAPLSHSAGVLVVAEFRARNLQRWTANLIPANSWIEDVRGGRVLPAGETSTVEKGFWLDWVQSGQEVEHRLVFEIDPTASGLTLNLLGIRFRLPPAAEA